MVTPNTVLPLKHTLPGDGYAGRLLGEGQAPTDVDSSRAAAVALSCRLLTKASVHLEKLPSSGPVTPSGLRDKFSLREWRGGGKTTVVWPYYSFHPLKPDRQAVSLNLEARFATLAGDEDPSASLIECRHLALDCLKRLIVAQNHQTIDYRIFATIEALSANLSPSLETEFQNLLTRSRCFSIVDQANWGKFCAHQFAQMVTLAQPQRFAFVRLNDHSLAVRFKVTYLPDASSPDLLSPDLSAPDRSLLGSSNLPNPITFTEAEKKFSLLIFDPNLTAASCRFRTCCLADFEPLTLKNFLFNAVAENYFQGFKKNLQDTLRVDLLPFTDPEQVFRIEDKALEPSFNVEQTKMPLMIDYRFSSVEAGLSQDFLLPADFSHQAGQCLADLLKAADPRHSELSNALLLSRLSASSLLTLFRQGYCRFEDRFLKWSECYLDTVLTAETDLSLKISLLLSPDAQGVAALKHALGGNQWASLRTYMEKITHSSLPFSVQRTLLLGNSPQETPAMAFVTISHKNLRLNMQYLEQLKKYSQRPGLSELADDIARLKKYLATY